jgi:hypothetical protein
LTAPTARAAAVAVAALALAAVPASVGADSFTPIRLNITVASVARLHQPLKTVVAVSADASVLDLRDGPIRARVKLASECGGDFEHTPGTTLVDQPLTPQPSTGVAFQGSATGSGRPAAYGIQAVCVYLEDQNEQRVFAHDTVSQVDVSRVCTSAASRYDRALAGLTRARKALKHAHGSASIRRLRAVVRRRAAAAGQARKRARVVCGAGVAL